jgi:predicted phosphoribosyltransferase
LLLRLFLGVSGLTLGLQGRVDKAQVAKVPFKDRNEAGKMLAEQPELRELAGAVVIALPRGGIPVAVEVARSLRAPVDVMPVEEISTPGKPEYVVGAVAENAIHVIDSTALEAMGVTEDSLAIRVAEATSVIARMSKIYRGEQGSALSVAGQTAVVVDDGSATGPALEAVALALSRRNVVDIWLATPVVPDGPVHGYSRIVTVPRSGEHADGMALVGLWYDDFTAPSDEVAAEALRDYVASHSSP